MQTPVGAPHSAGEGKATERSFAKAESWRMSSSYAGDQDRGRHSEQDKSHEMSEYGYIQFT